MYDLITIGSATLDIVVVSPDFLIKDTKEGVALCERYGEKMDVKELDFVSGGGATNVGVGAARLGLKTAVIAEVGKDLAAQVIFDDLKKDHVEDKFIVRERLEETAVSVLLVSADGGRSILTHRGAAYELESRDIPWKALEQTRWVHLGSLGGDKELIFDLFDFFRSRDIGVSWTPSKADLKLLANETLKVDHLVCEALLLNQEEWEMLDKINNDLSRKIALIVVTNGREGGRVLANGQEILTYQSIEVKTVEETGAGDAFATGVIGGLINGQPLPTCIEWGKRNAASVVQYYGAKKGLLTRSEMRI